MKILYTSPMLEHPPTSGPHLRIENSIKALAEISDLHIVSRVPKFLLGSKDAERFYRKFCGNFSYSPTVKGLSSNKWLRRAQKLSVKLIADDAKYLVNYARQHNIKIIWFGYGNLSYSVIKRTRQLAPDLKLICDTDSVWSRFIERESSFAQQDKQKDSLTKQVKQWQRDEQDWVNLCDITTAVSEVDAEYYRSLTTDKEKVAIFSNVLDLANYQTNPAATSRIKSPSIFLAGSFGKPTSAMNVAATWVIEEILPLVQQSIPNIHFYIAGRYSDVAFSDLKHPNITVAGMVDSVLPYLKNASVALTPLKFESGTRFKILEAGAAKIPMVSTTLGAEGLPVTHNQHLLLADTSTEFAAAICLLIGNDNLIKQLTENCYNMVKSYFSLTTLQNEAKLILSKVA